MLEIHQFAYNSDNYGVLVHDPQSGATASIDAGDAKAILQALEETGWTLSDLWMTHHHWDHTDGLAEIKAKTGAKVVGPDSVKGVDLVLKGGDTIEFAGQQVEILHTPGHTMDMLNYHLPGEKVVFTGDTLFVMGCGRLFEGMPAQMWESLQKLMALPGETMIYCAHEYTLASVAFAVTVDPENEALANRSEIVKAQRDQGLATVPSRLDIELATNPFLRPADPGIRKVLGMEEASDAEVFAEIRKRKDNF